ncbi:hypothetical protein P4O66_007761 [Electrophorus voltai]|uniref:Actin interacting protein 3-like C-terminal domain-containing protein n=1 Tax=Electrophorus voltai TaxID=2609070 RepID=A0AAD9DWR7_9TELE|nr:hypothetical protein P4O66_007761 [Electrophorus voltai]
MEKWCVCVCVCVRAHPERGGSHLMSTDDLEYPREYRTLGSGGRRFSNVGLVHTSEHRHTVLAAQSLEALSNLHKAEAERKRDAFMDHLKSKYPPQHSLPPSPSLSHSSMRGGSERSAREQQQPNYWSFKVIPIRACWVRGAGPLCHIPSLRLGCGGPVLSLFMSLVAACLVMSSVSPLCGRSSRVSPLCGHSSSVSPLCGHNSSVSPLCGHSYSVSPLCGHSYSVSPLCGHSSSVSPLCDHSSSVSPLCGHSTSVSPLCGHSSSVSPLCGYRTLSLPRPSAQSRSPRHSQSTQSGLADQASKLSFASAESLETMSEADMPLAFNRMNRFRQSLPLSRSASQSKLRSPGVLFLQFGDETRRVHITHELSSLETLHALIAHMFPQKLTASMLKSPNTAILIKDEARNVFYELEDVRDIQDRSVIKIYRKEPVYGSYGAAAHLANGDLRVRACTGSECDVLVRTAFRKLVPGNWFLREMVYTSHESSPTRRLNTLPSSTSTSGGSPARTRLSYAGGRPPSFSGQGHAHPQGSQHGHHTSPAHGPGSALTGSPSAILERRDVKPDEEVAGKGVVLLKAEGLYADPYGLVHEGRLSVASSGDPFGFPAPAGLYRRGSVRSLSTYSAAALQADLEEPLYKPGVGMYSDGYGPASTLAFRLPPSSPQKVPDVQLRDRDSYSNTPSRGSPVRQSFRKDSASSSVFVESPKSRPGSSSEPLGGDMGRGAPGFGSALVGSETDTSRDRMEAMEKQIASLTGLVQSVLTRAPDSDSTCGLLRLCMMAGCPPDQGAEFSRPFPFSSSEQTESASDGSAAGPDSGGDSVLCFQSSLTPSAPLALMPPPPSGPQDSTCRLQIQVQLQELKQNATDLRKQLSELRKIQLQSQQSVLSLMKRTETELSLRVSDALRKQEDPLQRQRLLVEEERLKYLNEEELIIQQLHDLEKSVEEIQKESSLKHRHVSVQELEEKTSVLRRLGETLTELKNQFPGLQSKMRVVLRVEVEAVKFLKEEPHRLDALLKRCKTITDTLATLKRQVNEGIRKSQEDFSNPSPKHTPGEDYKKSADFKIPTSPPLSLSESTLANWSPHSGHGHSHHGNPTSGQHGMGSLKGRVLEELGGRGGSDKTSSVEVRLAAERDWEEKRASLTQYSAQDINRLLEETQAELMKAIPDLDFAAKQIKPVQNQNASDPSSGPGATPEPKPSKVQHGTHKVSGKEGGSRRGSDELTVARYRTEKPSKSPPPPPPRRSFPSSPGLTSRTGELITPGKGMKKSESEEAEAQKPHVKLRRSVSEAPRPASTPPTVAGGKTEDGENEKTVAENEVESAPDTHLRQHGWGLPHITVHEHVIQVYPHRTVYVLVRLTLAVPTSAAQVVSRKSPASQSSSSEGTVTLQTAQRGPSSSSVPQIVLTECISVPVSTLESSGIRSSGTVQQDRNGMKDVTVPSYFRHVVKIPGQVARKQVLVTSPKHSPVQDSEKTPTELQAWMRTTRASLPGEKVVSPPRKMELRIQESFEMEDEKEPDVGGKHQRTCAGDARASPCLFQPGVVSALALSTSTRGQGVGEERRDIKHTTYQHLDSLEETIRELELSLLEFSPPPYVGHLSPLTAQAQSPSPGWSALTAAEGEAQKLLVPPKPSVVADATKVQPRAPPLLSPGTSSVVFSTFLWFSLQPPNAPLIPSLIMVVQISYCLYLEVWCVVCVYVCTGGGKAISRLKQLQQSGCEKSKLGKHKDDFLKSQGQQQVQPLTPDLRGSPATQLDCQSPRQKAHRWARTPAPHPLPGALQCYQVGGPASTPGQGADTKPMQASSARPHSVDMEACRRLSLSVIVRLYKTV